MLKDPFSRRLLKRVQMQGGAPISRWVPGEVRDVLSLYVAAPRERGGTHSRWVPADEPFSVACYAVVVRAGRSTVASDPTTRMSAA